MTSNSNDTNKNKRGSRQESLFHMSYQNGKPVKVKEPTETELLQKELVPDEDKNDADIEKSALYADLPKAKLKMDRSINARALNSMVESYMQHRLETKFTYLVPDCSNPSHALILTGPWRFRWDIKTGTVTTIEKPSDGYNIEYKNSTLTSFTKENLQKIYKILEQNIKLKKK